MAGLLYMKLCYLHEQTDGIMHDSTGSLVRFYLRWNGGKEQWQIGLYGGTSREKPYSIQKSGAHSGGAGGRLISLTFAE